MAADRFHGGPGPAGSATARVDPTWARWGCPRRFFQSLAVGLVGPRSLIAEQFQVQSDGVDCRVVVGALPGGQRPAQRDGIRLGEAGKSGRFVVARFFR